MTNPTRLLIFATLCSGAGILACDGGDAEACGLSTAVPEVADGRVTATVDGAAFDESGSYSPTTGSFTAGLLDIIISKDENGDDTMALIADESFPICIQLGERSDTSGNANFVEGGFVTDADHTGSLVIAAVADEMIVGRFELTLGNSAGETKTFEDGAFKIPER